MAPAYALAAVDIQASGVSYALAGLDVVAGGAAYALAGLDVVAGDGFQVTLGPNPPRFDPFDIAALTASSLSVPNSWTFTQLSGPPVVLSGSGGSRTYRCPGRLVEQTLTFRVVATLGALTATAEVTHVVAPHAGIFGPDGVGWQYHPAP